MMTIDLGRRSRLRELKKKKKKLSQVNYFVSNSKNNKEVKSCTLEVNACSLVSHRKVKRRFKEQNILTWSLPVQNDYITSNILNCNVILT